MHRPSTRTRALNVVAFTVTGAVQPALKLLLLPLITRMLGAAGLGHLAFVDAWMLGAAVAAHIGVPHYFLRNHAHVDAQALHGTLSRYLIGHNVVLATLLVAAGWWVEDPITRRCFQIACITNGLAGWMVIPLRELRVRERAVAYGAVVGGLGAAQTAAGLAGAWVGQGPESWYTGQLLVTLPVALALAAWSLWHTRAASFDRDMLAGALRLGVSVSLSSVGTIAVNVADRIQLKYIVSVAEVGTYSVGYSIGMGTAFVNVALYTALEPGLYRHKEDGAFAVDFVRAFGGSQLLIVALVTTIDLLAAPLGRSFLGVEFEPSIAVARIVAPSALLLLAQPFFTLCAIRAGQQRILAPITIVGAVTNLAVNALAVPRFGILAAAYSTFAAYFVMTLLFATVTWRDPALRRSHLAALAAPLCLLGGAAVTPTGVAATLPLLAGLVAAVTIRAAVGAR